LVLADFGAAGRFTAPSPAPSKEKQRMDMLKEFKDWIVKGNLIAIAVGLIIALAFADLVASFVKNIITPIIGAIGGTPDFSAKSFSINGSVFTYGSFINALITFLVVAFVMFLVVKASLKVFKEKPEAPAEYVVEKYDAAAINARSADGWEVVSAGDGGVVMKK
jgi:large conductance mechanosensitive channel